MAAKCVNKPFYAAAESFKFLRSFPLTQKDVPPQSASSSVLSLPPNVDTINALFDFTPPQYIKLLFTDLGVLAPSAVSDELIKLHMEM